MATITWNCQDRQNLLSQIRHVENEINHDTTNLTDLASQKEYFASRLKEIETNSRYVELLKAIQDLKEEGIYSPSALADVQHAVETTYQIRYVREQLAQFTQRHAFCSNRLKDHRQQLAHLHQTLRRLPADSVNTLTTERLQRILKGVPHLDVDQCTVGYTEYFESGSRGWRPTVMLLFRNITLTPIAYPLEHRSRAILDFFQEEKLRTPSFAIGDYAVKIDVTNANIKFRKYEKNACPIFPWASSFAVHPHTLDGTPCFGNLTAGIAEAVKDQAWDILALYLYQFLSHAVHTDSAGRSWVSGYSTLARAAARAQGLHIRSPSCVQTKTGKTWIIAGTLVGSDMTLNTTPPPLQITVDKNLPVPSHPPIEIDLSTFRPIVDSVTYRTGQPVYYQNLYEAFAAQEHAP